ncbi:MAG: TolC family protein [Deltaproteobacteria bacterium]
MLPLLVVLLLFAERAAAQARALSLRDAIALAVRQNPPLAAAGAEVRIAEAGMLAARGLDDFVLQARADWRDTRRGAAPRLPEQAQAFHEVSGSLSLTRPLAAGGRVGLHLQAGYGRTRFGTDLDAMMLERSASEAYAPSLQLSLEQPLLRGFGADVARADRRRARIQRSVAAAEREGLAASLVREIVSGYWNLAYSAEELAIRRASAAAAREQLLRVQANIAVGKLPQSASAEIEVAIALRDDSVLLAELVVTDRSLALGLACGVPISERLAAADTLSTADIRAPAARAPEEALETALAENPQLRAVSEQGRGRAIEIDVTENGLLPQLDFTAAGGPVGNARDVSGAYEQMTRLGSYTITAGLAFTLPIGRHAARGAQDAAREGLRKARLGEAQLAAQIAAAVLGGIARRETARRRAEVLGPSARTAALDLEAEKARFEVGRASNFDVLRRQDQLAAVQILLLRARLDELDAWAELDALTGEILDRNGVVVGGGDP